MDLNHATILRASAAMILVFSLFIGCGDDDVNAPPIPEVEYGTLTGKAYLFGTSAVIPGVIITIAGMTDTTGEDGLFEINNIPEGTYTLSATRDDYSDYQNDIEIMGSTTASVSMRLSITDAVVSGVVTHPYYGVISAVSVDVGGMSDVTDQDGRFIIYNAPVGEQILTCTHSTYNDLTDTVYVISSEQEINITLIRTVLSNVLIERDATVKLNSQDGDVSEVNYGFSGELDLYYINDNFNQLEINRIFIELPSLPSMITIDQLEKALLVLTRTSGIAMGMLYDPKTVRALRVRESWEEGSVTYKNSPLTEDSILVTGEVRTSSIIEFNLLEYYRDSTNIENGLLLLLDSDYKSDYTGSQSTERAQFYSSETNDDNVIPRVEFQYTH